jgi:hypothetical protein
MSPNPSSSKIPFFQKSVWFIYPFLLACYPVLALRNNNIIYVDFSSILRTLLLVIAATAVLGVLTLGLVRNLEKTGVIVSLVIAFFLAYGHIYIQLNEALGQPVQHRYLLGGGILVILGLSILVLKSNAVTRFLSQFLSVVSGVLLVLVLFVSIRHDLDVYRAMRAAQKSEASNVTNPTADRLPDVYLILLDGHTRSDVLKTRFGYDNSDFVRQLEAMGFFVASCSQSNYPSTKLSLTSAFYGDYIQNIVVGGTNLPPLETSPLVQALKSRGYKIIAFENRAHGHFDLKEDIRLARHQMAFGQFDLRGGLNEFEKMMVDTSLLRFALDTEIIPGFDNDTVRDWEDREHYYQTLFIMSELQNLPEMPGPKFVFAHIMVPHAPYIFAVDGSYAPVTSPINGYRANSEFLDTHLPAVLQAIIAKSDPSPVIIVMGDHGPPIRSTVTKEMRMANLSAYRVNEAGRAQLYPTITPVNAMRVILNAHFGGDFPLMPDTSYYADQVADLEKNNVIENVCPILP